MAYEYKTVPAPMVLKEKNEQDAHASIRSYGERINDEAVDGWEFYSMETITTAQAPGCGGGGKEVMTSYNMFVFRRAEEEKESA